MTRCTATAYGARCEMPAGHEGRHRGQIPNPHRRTFWLSTPRATGVITTDGDGVVVGGCPYFTKAHRGRHLNDVIRAERRRHPDVRWHEYAPARPSPDSPVAAPRLPSVEVA